MSKRKPMDKAQARERRNQLLEAAASAELSLTEGVREMRAIAGMTQEEFAQHRGVSARVIKAIELGQGNPTVATLNRIGQFFGLEVAFVPVKRAASSLADAGAKDADAATWFAVPKTVVENIDLAFSKVQEMLDALDRAGIGKDHLEQVEGRARAPSRHGPAQPKGIPEDTATGAAPARKKSKPRSS
jgi:DNA-binding XRE family transcriptional regulator